MARVLLDESLPRQLAPLLVGHAAQTVPQAGWAGLSNGELLRRAETRFDVLVTGDRNIQYQQNLASLKVGLVLVAAPNNRVETICALARRIPDAINTVRPGQVQVVAA